MKQLIKQLFCKHYYRDYKAQRRGDIYRKRTIYLTICEKCEKTKDFITIAIHEQ